ncbi:f-boxfbd/lrr-repeat protein [Nicotiana attenuata]|uniref:F-boxfbd/lrr-repeat protein n=1 Tax=Nicotiana attenuata TaxID=49451 RepID=A0A314KWG7_NICAT|nr:f-boxfbd/lrr-repeat protein [Nicotiana attenuata]
MKKSKLTERVVGDDVGTLNRISELPDSLLVRIISLLPTTNDAFRTCLVYKRWQYLWTSIDNLTLVCRSRSKEENFASFMDYLFAKRTSSKIRKFHLEIWDMPSYNLQIKQWLSYVIKTRSKMFD